MKWKSILPAVVFFVALIAGTIVFNKFPISRFFAATRGPEVEVDWRLLSGMDYVTGKAPAELSSLNGKNIRVPGFMVPLEDNQKSVTQFLLVPSPQACIHVPPPPPNQMLVIEATDGVGVMYGPIWVHGSLEISTQRTQYGDVAFKMKAQLVEPYQ